MSIVFIVVHVNVKKNSTYTFYCKTVGTEQGSSKRKLD